MTTLIMILVTLLPHPAPQSHRALPWIYCGDQGRAVNSRTYIMDCIKRDAPLWEKR